MAEIAAPNISPDGLRATPLDQLHRALGGRMVPFAGWELPVHYPAGVLAEHRRCRAAAVLFDVSHMGQVGIEGPAADRALERLSPGDIQGLKAGRQRYSVLVNEVGGIIDDIMVARFDRRLLVVCNAGRVTEDLRHLALDLPAANTLVPYGDRALLALQGPRAGAALAKLAPATAAMRFMDVAEAEIAGAACWISRSGYTGEDGFEISVPAARATDVAGLLLADPDVTPAGLGARDSLRLEAGLPLYGQDIDELTSPVEAGLGFAIGRRRREAWDFQGGVVVRDHFRHGPTRRRVGLRPADAAPARAGTPVLGADGTAAGTVTSGGFSPTLGAPVAMGYVRADLAADGTGIRLTVRGRDRPARICPLPFVPHAYAR